MKLLTRKNAVSTVLLSCTLLFTITASAEEISLERSLAAAIQAQGQKAVHDLSAELSNSIKAELKRLSMRYTTAKSDDIATISIQKKLGQQKQQTSEE